MMLVCQPVLSKSVLCDWLLILLYSQGKIPWWLQERHTPRCLVDVNGGISITISSWLLRRSIWRHFMFLQTTDVSKFSRFDISIICVVSHYMHMKWFSCQGWRWWWWWWCYSDDQEAFQHYLASNNWIFLTRHWDTLQPKNSYFYIEVEMILSCFYCSKVEYFQREVWTLSFSHFPAFSVSLTPNIIDKKQQFAAENWRFL